MVLILFLACLPSAAGFSAISDKTKRYGFGLQFRFRSMSDHRISLFGGGFGVLLRL